MSKLDTYRHIEKVNYNILVLLTKVATIIYFGAVLLFCLLLVATFYSLLLDLNKNCNKLTTDINFISTVSTIISDILPLQLCNCSRELYNVKTDLACIG